MKTRLQIILSFVCVLLIASGVCEAARLKDVADIEGVRGNQLFGFGVVVGLNGTGDGGGVEFTRKSLANILEKLGLRIDPETIKAKNVASVMVTATLPAFIRPGTKLDVTLSSIGDAKSLLGGTLIFTPLRGADGNVYAVSQGEVSVGGFTVAGGGDSAQKNHPTVANIANGAVVERAIPFDLFQSKRVRIVLRTPDFTTMTHVVKVINDDLGRPLAAAVDAAAVEIPLLDSFARDPIGLVARLEQLDVEIDVGAKVVVNERTGTIIMGEAVRIGKVGLAHGNLNISIRSQTGVSQPSALSQGGQTAVVTNTDVHVNEENPKIGIVGGGVTLGELVTALNGLGAAPRDLISIFNALKKAGALQADLVVM